MIVTNNMEIKRQTNNIITTQMVKYISSSVSARSYVLFNKTNPNILGINTTNTIMHDVNIKLTRSIATNTPKFW